MACVAYSAQNEKTSPLFARAFALGCGGWATPAVGTLAHPGAMAAFGTPSSWPLFEQAKAEGRDWYYGDHGLFRRFRYYRVTKNRLQPTGAGVHASDRWDALHVDRVPTWQTGGAAVIVCPQSPVYMEYYFGHTQHEVAPDPTAYYTKLVQPFTDRPVIVRWKKEATTRPLRVDLQIAHMVVAWSSASAIEALAAGIPVCTLAPWASSFTMGITQLSDLETPYYPDIAARDQFLFNLAYAQWTMEEIETGVAWRSLNP